MADTTTGVTYEKGRLYNIPIGDIKPDPNQPRKYMDPQGMDEMTASVAQYGIIEPIVSRWDPQDNQVYVVAGERRLEAAKRAGLTAVPAIFVEGNHAEIALVENLLRQDLTAVEEAEALKSLMDNQKYSQEQLAATIGKARTTINEILSLNRLPQGIRDQCRGDAKVTRSTLIEIARKKQERAMLTAWAKYQEKLVKQQEGRKTPTSTANDPDALLTWLSKTVSKLKESDCSAWSEEQRLDFNELLTALGEAIGNILHPPRDRQNGDVTRHQNLFVIVNYSVISISLLVSVDRHPPLERGLGRVPETNREQTMGNLRGYRPRCLWDDIGVTETMHGVIKSSCKALNFKT